MHLSIEVGHQDVELWRVSPLIQRVKSIIAACKQGTVIKIVYPSKVPDPTMNLTDVSDCSTLK